MILTITIKKNFSVEFAQQSRQEFIVLLRQIRTEKHNAISQILTL